MPSHESFHDSGAAVWLKVHTLMMHLLFARRSAYQSDVYGSAAYESLITFHFYMGTGANLMHFLNVNCNPNHI